MCMVKSQQSALHTTADWTERFWYEFKPFWLCNTPGSEVLRSALENGLNIKRSVKHRSSEEHVKRSNSFGNFLPLCTFYQWFMGSCVWQITHHINCGCFLATSNWEYLRFQCCDHWNLEVKTKWMLPVVVLTTHWLITVQPASVISRETLISKDLCMMTGMNLLPVLSHIFLN